MLDYCESDFILFFRNRKYYFNESIKKFDKEILLIHEQSIIFDFRLLTETKIVL